MNQPRQNRNEQRRRNKGGNNGARPGRQAAKHDIWSEPGPLPEFEPLTISRDPTALLRSLGEPPLNRGIEAGYTFGSAIERAAGIATALAFSADLLDQPLD